MAFPRGRRRFTDTRSDITKLIQQSLDGDRAALDLLFPIFYEDLHRIARSYFARESDDHTLQPTAIIHEVYINLMQKKNLKFENRAHFLALSSLLMRRMLVDHARARRRVKRGGKMAVIEINDELIGKKVDIDLFVDIDIALTKLEKLDPRQARIVELRFFGGLTVEEIADALHISARTVESDWYMARAWLRREFAGQTL